MSVLDAILARKKEEVESLRAHAADLRAKTADLPPCRGLAKGLSTHLRDPSLLAEVKSASPSQGTIRSQFDPVSVAKSYEISGAAGISVLTDGPSFGGSIEHLKQVRAAVSLPILRKEFIIDELQVVEARATGADAILLIAAALPRERLVDLRGVAGDLGMDVLVEIHDESELEAALYAESEMLGVNNRDLGTLECDLAVAERLLPMIPDDRVKIAESGVSGHEDVERMHRAGARSLLIGTAFCREPDIEGSVNRIMGWSKQ